MNLHTERLILRPWNEADAESLYEYAKDDRVGPVAGWPAHTSVENSREIIKNVLSAPETYAVCLKEDNKAIGSIGLMIGKSSNLDLPENEGEIGYWIGVPFWGKGLIPEAVRELIRHSFVDLGIETLWCGYFDGNEKSKRCQEKCGFVYHHTNKNICWKLMNDVRTEHITRLTRDEYVIIANEVNSMDKDRRKNMIETERLKIYPASKEQMEAFIAAQTIEILKAAYSEMLEGALTHPEQWEWYAIWMIELKDGTHIGELCFKGIDESGSVETGYGINENYQNCGYATEAVNAAADWALRHNTVNCVTAEVDKDNIASVRVLEKSGFEPTGIVGEEGPIYSKASDIPLR